MTCRVSETTTLDEIIEDFIAGRANFEQFRDGVEEQLARHPELTESSLLWLESLRRDGQLSPALHALMADVVADSSAGDRTPPFGDEDTLLEPPLPGERTWNQPDHEVPSGAPAPAPAPAPARAERPARRAAAPGAGAAPRVQRSAPVGMLIAGRYQLKALLGRGGMSLVYRAEDTRRAMSSTEDASVAVKLLAPAYVGRAGCKALEREAAVLAELDHPGVVRLLDAGADRDNFFIVMELLDGERLRDLLMRRRPGALPPDEAMQITAGLGDALAYLHRKGVVHRDVKPANVYIQADGRVRLIDFGLAAEAGGDGPNLRDSPARSPRGPQSFTPLYASPEMLVGAPPDPRDDVYSFACVVYEMLTGRQPWGNLPADEAAHRKLQAARPTGLSAPRWAVLQKALSFRAADRPPDAGAFLDAFLAPARSRNTLKTIAAALLVGAVAVGVALYTGPAGIPTVQLPSPQGGAPVALPAVEDEPVASAPAMPETPQAADERPGEPAMSETPPPAAPVAADPAPPTVRDTVAQAVEPAEAPATAPAPAAPVREPAVTAPPASAAPAPEPRVRPPPAAVQPRAPPVLAFSNASYRITKSGGALRLELLRPARYEGPLRARWRTVDRSAREGQHFIGSPAWQYTEAPAGAPALVLFVPIVHDMLPGPDRSFLVELEDVPGGPSVGAPARAEVTIVNEN
jgi:hypothetical protein